MTAKAQQVYTREDVRALFPGHVKNLWINNLSGTLDNKHRVDMIIGTDGEQCKGLYTMRNSGETFFFEGDNLNGELKLVELAGGFKTSGFIVGHYDGASFNGQWMNVDKDISLDLDLNLESQVGVLNPNACINEAWYRLYSGKIESENARLLLVKENKSFKLFCYLDSLRFVDIIPVKNRSVEMLTPDFKSDMWKQYSIIVDANDLKQVKLVRASGGDFELITILKEAAFLDLECFEYADYYSRLVVERPVSDNKKFNKWIESKLMHWMQDNIEDLKEIKKDDIGTKDRWIQYIDGWVEIDLFTGDFISGTVYLQSSLKVGTQKIPFIYDLRFGKELKLQDLFVKEFNAKDYFKEKIAMQKMKVSWKPEMKKWIEKEPFGFVTVKESGLSFKTELNAIYGEKEIIIPYNEIKENIKVKNLLNGLIRN